MNPIIDFAEMGEEAVRQVRTARAHAEALGIPCVSDDGMTLTDEGLVVRKGFVARGAGEKVRVGFDLCVFSDLILSPAPPLMRVSIGDAEPVTARFLEVLEILSGAPGK